MIDLLSLMQKLEFNSPTHLSNSFLGMITSTDIPTELLILSSTWKSKIATKPRKYKTKKLSKRKDINFSFNISLTVHLHLKTHLFILSKLIFRSFVRKAIAFYFDIKL